jgi:hypothetical protein
MTLEHFIFAGGIIQLGILIGSATVPGVLRWADELKAVSLVSRQLIWVHGAFIVLVIIGFGMLAILFPKELAAGAPMSRGVCAFIGLFWLVRLLLQFVLFDPALSTFNCNGFGDGSWRSVDWVIGSRDGDADVR